MSNINVAYDNMREKTNILPVETVILCNAKIRYTYYFYYKQIICLRKNNFKELFVFQF